MPEFLDAVQSEFGLSVDGGAVRLVNGVLHALGSHIDSRTLEDIKQELPEDIAELVPRV